MNVDIIKGHWNEIKGKLKQQWGKFTDDEIEIMEGNYDELKGNLQKKYGYKVDQAEEEINAFVKRNKFDDDETH